LARRRWVEGWRGGRGRRLDKRCAREGQGRSSLEDDSAGTRQISVWGEGVAAARSSGSSRRGRGRRAEAGRARGGGTWKNGGGGRMVGGGSAGVGKEED
jgi:hypothetical protein